MSDEKSQLLGPFLGHVTSSSIKIWLHYQGPQNSIYVSVHPVEFEATSVANTVLTLSRDRLFTDWTTIENLEPDTKYFYKLWTDAGQSVPLPLEGLTPRELYFRTLSDDPNAQIDFVVMSCHNPDVSTRDGHEGYAVWSDIPQIIARDNNEKVRFALLVGDQVYADYKETEILNAKSEDERLGHYLAVYRNYWGNINYRRVLCSLPAVMMWDDHDITDGWGSELRSFVGKTSDFKPEWKNLFDAASKAFGIMQGSRNPDALASDPKKDGRDFCFHVGKWGFLFLDLRTNRNLRLSRVHTAEQMDRIRAWVKANQKEMHSLFVISPVVFSHGAPVLEDLAVRHWRIVLTIVNFFANLGKWGRGLHSKFYKHVGDIRDDIRDNSWSAEENAEQTEELLNFLFNLQNDEDDQVNVVIVSGDIHASGYANIYSNYQRHAGRSSIVHITSSSVAYTPFSWLLEAIYRFATKSVLLGKSGSYSSQVSHHFTARSVAVLSLRPGATVGDHLLKVKFYLENYPEPQVLLFDLRQVSHRENISWSSQDKLSQKEYAPTAYLTADRILTLRAQAREDNLNWRESIVDLLKLLEMDHSVEARRQLAIQFGYMGSLNDKRELNIFVLDQMKKQISEKGLTPFKVDQEINS